ncbi:hypothetical protein [Clostridium gasigenes]|uniref:Uncharacterized protein n=1 Tax=Clostridium gasigenes TaxID=94869 RepID=A0A1H0VGG0_9CLOT|nr:hypothetical protein [Clostridium gasigenes]SDP77423.1 hypothetical protein SAMN04488529_11656 [Clostridium gasigenes]
MSSLLRPDKIMNGLITNLIEEIWKENKKKNLKLLISMRFKIFIKL